MKIEYRKNLIDSLALLLVNSALICLAGCASQEMAGQSEANSPVTPDPFYAQLRPATETGAQRKSTAPDTTYKTRIVDGPGVVVSNQVADVEARDMGAQLTGNKISGNYNNMPLPTFINEVFGEQLGMPGDF